MFYVSWVKLSLYTIFNRLWVYIWKMSSKDSVVNDVKNCLLFVKFCSLLCLIVWLCFISIYSIDDIPEQYHHCTTLNLSHNQLSSITNLQQFTQLQSLNLSYNHLTSITCISALTHLSSSLTELYFEGNPFSSHPDYRSIIIQIFTQLRKLDGKPIRPSEKENIEDSKLLAAEFLPFTFHQYKQIQELQNKLKRRVIKKELYQRVSETWET